VRPRWCSPSSPARLFSWLEPPLTSTMQALMPRSVPASAARQASPCLPLWEKGTLSCLLEGLVPEAKHAALQATTSFASIAWQGGEVPRPGFRRMCIGVQSRGSGCLCSVGKLAPTRLHGKSGQGSRAETVRASEEHPCQHANVREHIQGATHLLFGHRADIARPGRGANKESHV
jgi:hypothetical protein